MGDYIKFGLYEQDCDKISAIEWLVLEVKDSKGLLISRYGLDCKGYNSKSIAVTWETCSLRKWLNSDFFDSAFNDSEKAMISTVTVPADKNPRLVTNKGNDTHDKVFLLSITEVTKYFSSNTARQCKATSYAKSQGEWIPNGNCVWWLRSLGFGFDELAGGTCVESDGSVNESGYNVESNDLIAVRPALWIDLNA